MDDIITTITKDYAKFPESQTYEIYCDDVYFRDPVYQFRGLAQYQKMIGFITYWFKNLKLELHSIERQSEVVTTRWTMSWNAPLPWQPRVSVTGWSELTVTNQVNEMEKTAGIQEKICSHVDYWHCTKWDLIRQHFVMSQPN